MAEYIDKKQAIDRIASCYCMNCEHSNGILCRACEHQDDMDLIDDMPAAGVQPVKRGHWIEIDYGMFYECSECGNVREFERNFCSNCGADMRGDENA